jgi:hypothetical protein
MSNKKLLKVAEKYACKNCHYITSKLSSWKKHLQTKKHNAHILVNKDELICNFCNKHYKHRQSLDRHLKKEHDEQNETKVKQNETKICFQKVATTIIKHNNNNKYENYENYTDVNKKVKQNETCPKIYNCNFCNQYFASRSTLWRHKKICEKQITSNNLSEYELDMKKIIIDLMKKNTEILEEVKEIAKEPKIINNNTQFNIMNYLNNECKDAMNLTDFINELPFSLDDLEIMGTKGYQQSMEQTFVKQLRNMEKTRRPIHCSDRKRKSFYIKDDNIWEKDENNSKIENGLKKIYQKHMGILSVWTNYNKNWSYNERKQDFFNRSVQEVAKYNDNKQVNKIINKLTGLSIK